MRKHFFQSTTIAALAVIVFTIALGGCAEHGGIPMLDPLAMRDSANPVSWDEILATRLHRSFEQQRRLRETYETTSDCAARRAQRDAIAFAALGWIEEYAQRSRIRLATARAMHDAAGDVAVIGLSTAATLAGGDAVKSALSAAAAAFAGANRAIDARFLSEQTTAAIISQMEINHRTARTNIERRLHTLDDNEYPLAAVDVDLIECLYAGTPTSALASLADEAALRRATLQGKSANPCDPKSPAMP